MGLDMYDMWFLNFHYPINQYVTAKATSLFLKLRTVCISDEHELEFSGSSRAEPGHLNFRAENELAIFLDLWLF